ncbi:MAG: transcriptional regulator [Symploca sp. SIO2D2]|nr:transcriptional regulator [Symploca sp. SIO2D2]
MIETQQVLQLARDVGVIRAKDIISQGIHPSALQRLEKQGLLIKSARGLYTHVNANITEQHSLVEAAKRVPKGVICLLSALSFYELTTQAPFEVWMAISSKTRRPNDSFLPLRIVYASEAILYTGVEEHVIEGIPVKVYSVSRTVTNCFKHRNKLGLDVALEALRESWRERRCSMDELWKAAKIDRVQNVMRPYLESLE